ncbi:MAG TPA: outer membrane beta-barrel protein [Verrucomicrobiae bacterium]|nr:outer membrane beta-barrel protein [Verrucomicrobiae bacterium]
MTGAAGCAWAQAPSNLDLGGPDARARISAHVFYTDNYYYEPTAPEAAWGTVLRPELVFIAETGKTALHLTGWGEYGHFDIEGPITNYFDGYGGARLLLVPTARNRLTVDASWQHGHDPFGLARTEGTAVGSEREQDEWDHRGGGLRYRYGAPAAKVNAELGVAVAEREYLTNELETRFLDFQTVTLDYGLSYNIGPKTALVANFTRTDTEFDVPFDTNPFGADVDDRSGPTYQVRAGVRWLATAKTSGDVQAGYRQRHFDAGSDNLEGFDWQAGVRWSPVATTLIDIRTARSEQQSYRSDARVIDVRSATLSLRRAVGTRTTIIASGGRTDADFIGSGREDRVDDAALGLEYRALSYLFVVGNVGVNNRVSNLADRSYDRLNAFFGVRLGR